MQGVERADVLLYFKCPTTKQMRCHVNAYSKLKAEPVQKLMRINRDNKKYPPGQTKKR